MMSQLSDEQIKQRFKYFVISIALTLLSPLVLLFIGYLIGGNTGAYGLMLFGPVMWGGFFLNSLVASYRAMGSSWIVFLCFVGHILLMMYVVLFPKTLPYF